jgi:hypothetical protein
MKEFHIDIPGFSIGAKSWGVLAIREPKVVKKFFYRCLRVLVDRKAEPSEGGITWSFDRRLKCLRR